MPNDLGENRRDGVINTHFLCTFLQGKKDGVLYTGMTNKI